MTQLNDVPMHRIHAAQSIARELDIFVDRHPRAMVGKLRPLIDHLSRTLRDGPQGASAMRRVGLWTLLHGSRAASIRGPMDAQPQAIVDTLFHDHLPPTLRSHVSVMKADTTHALPWWWGGLSRSIPVHVVSDGHADADGEALLTFRPQGHHELDEREVRVSSSSTPEASLGQHEAPHNLWLEHLLALVEVWGYEPAGNAIHTEDDNGAPLAIVPVHFRDGGNGFVWAQRK